MMTLTDALAHHIERNASADESAARDYEERRAEPPAGGRGTNPNPKTYGRVLKDFIDRDRRRAGLTPRLWKSVGDERWVIDHDAERDRDAEAVT